MPKNQVSVVIINYNSSKYTIDCIKSIKDVVESIIDYNIVVIDNN